MKTLLPLLSLLLLLLACSEPTSKKTSEDSSEAPIAESEWTYLFDGSSLEGWRGFNMDTLPASWMIEDGVLKCLGEGGDIGGDVVYAAREFDNFELALEWKISEGGNSGVFYHVVEGPEYEAPYFNAPEYQVLDDIGFPAPLEAWQKLGADYAMYLPDNSKKIVKPAGEWNTSRIVFTPERAEHWLNGQLLLSFVPWSEDWEQRKAAGKWKEFPEYGQARSGYIGLQDHGGLVWFRNIKVRERYSMVSAVPEGKASSSGE